MEQQLSHHLIEKQYSSISVLQQVWLWTRPENAFIELLNAKTTLSQITCTFQSQTKRKTNIPTEEIKEQYLNKHMKGLNSWNLNCSQKFREEKGII